MVYNYQITHTNGSASGSVEAETQLDAEKSLRLLYTHVDKDHPENSTEVTHITLEPQKK